MLIQVPITCQLPVDKLSETERFKEESGCEIRSGSGAEDGGQRSGGGGRIQSEGLHVNVVPVSWPVASIISVYGII